MGNTGSVVNSDDRRLNCCEAFNRAWARFLSSLADAEDKVVPYIKACTLTEETSVLLDSCYARVNECRKAVYLIKKRTLRLLKVILKCSEKKDCCGEAMLAVSSIGSTYVRLLMDAAWRYKLESTNEYHNETERLLKKYKKDVKPVLKTVLCDKFSVIKLLKCLDFPKKNKSTDSSE